MAGKSKKKKDKQGGLKQNKQDLKKEGSKVSGKFPAAVRLEQIVYYLLFAAIAVLLVVGPFERGLFFPRDLLVTQVVVFALLAAWGLFRLLKKDKRFISTPLDVCLLVLLAAYFSSFFFAVHKRDALEEVLKIGMYIVIYLIAIDLCRYWQNPLTLLKKEADNKGDIDSLPRSGQNVMLHLLLVVAFIVTIASLGAAAGHWTFAGAYASNRIASPMGYANTAAAYLMAAYFLTLALAPLAGRRFRLIYLAPAAIMLLTVILTFSRGAWLLLPPLAVLLVIVSAPGERLRTLLYLAATSIAALPAALLADPVFRSDNPPLAWLYILAAGVVAFLLGNLVELYLSRSRKLQLALAGGAGALAIVLILVFIIIPATGPVTLEQPADKAGQLKGVSQVLENIERDQDYELVLEVNALVDAAAQADDPEYAWGVRVMGGLPGYRNEELVNYRGGDTDGWQEKSFSFRTREETTRLEVQIYNQHQGTAATVRSVYLETPERGQKLNFALSRIMPQRFYDRIFSYSRDRNLDRRLELFDDAMKIIRDYPLTGTGGGGWAAMYHGYQDQPYSSREVHNHYLQVWLEAGIFGFLAFIGIWISFAIAFIRNCYKDRASPVRWQLWTAAFLPAAALGAHSVIDWNFSMAAVGFYLFVLLGVGRSLDNISWFGKAGKDNNLTAKKDHQGVVVGILGLLFGIALFSWSLVLLTGHDATWRSQELMERGNIKQAMIEMEKGIRLDPYRTDNYHNLAVYLEEQGRRTGSVADIQQALAFAEQAYRLEPFNPTYVVRYGDMLLNYVGVDEGLYYTDQVVNLRPFAADSYIQPTWSRLRLMEFFAESGERAETERLYNEIKAFRDLMEEKMGDSTELSFILGRAKYLVGKIPEAIGYFRMVPEGDRFYGEAQNRLSEILDNNRVIEEDEEVEDNEEGDDIED